MIEDSYLPKKNTIFIKNEGELALFYSFGERIIIRHSLNVILPKVFDALVSLPSGLTIGEDTRQLAAACSVEHDALIGFLDQLNKKSLVLKGSRTNTKMTNRQAAASSFFSRFSASAQVINQHTEALRSARIHIYSELDCKRFFDSFFDFGFTKENFSFRKFTEDPSLEKEENDLAICLATSRDMPLVREWNKSMANAKRNWLFVHLDPFGAMVGPYFGQVSGICFDCLIKRRNANIYEPKYQDFVDNFQWDRSVTQIDELCPFSRSTFEALKLNL